MKPPSLAGRHNNVLSRFVSGTRGYVTDYSQRWFGSPLYHRPSRLALSDCGCRIRRNSLAA